MPGDRKKILVIEDDPQTRANVATILEMEGFHPVTAPDGRAGVAFALRDPPDLIICDVMMPELDGYGVLESLRGHVTTAAIPFIFLTAKGEKEDLRVGMNLGADDYLTKPVGMDDLLAAIGARLQRKKESETAVLEKAEFKPRFESSKPLEALGLTPREAEVLLWIAQGKSNSDIATILDLSDKTVKVHATHIFEKLGVESRGAASLQALEILGAPSARRCGPV